VVIGISPVLVDIGPFAVRWFGLVALVGLGLAIWLSLRELERQKLARKTALDALAWALPAGLLSARLTNVLGNWDSYLTDGAALWRLDITGLSLWGGLLGGGLIAAARLKRDPLRRRRLLDAVAPFVALGIALGRFGEFLEGTGQGPASSLPWATRYTNALSATPDFGVLRQPVQLYDALLALAVFAAVGLLPRRMPAGSRIAAFLVMYGLGSFALGLVRLEPAFLFGLQLGQLLAIAGVIFGLGYWARPLLSQRVQRVRLPTVGAHRQSRAKEDGVAA
jgi:phosphatidylglycerol:prolipoprotein diacylglycerol transferase